MNDIRQLWVSLSASPLLHLTLTLIAFQLGAQPKEFRVRHARDRVRHTYLRRAHSLHPNLPPRAGEVDRA